MTFGSNLLQDIALSVMLPMGIIVVGLILNTLFGLMTGRTRINKSFDLNAHSKFSLILIILWLGALMGGLFQESLFQNFLLAVDGLAFVSAFLFLVAVFALAKWLRGQKIDIGLRLAALIGFAVAASILLFLGVGRGINAWEIASVHSYVAHAVPILDELKARGGAYPSTLPVSSLGAPPTLLRRFGEYTSNGTEFRFEYVNDPAGWAGGRDDYAFDSSTRQWTSGGQ